MSQENKHIVLVTTWFPPWQSVAVNRMLAFAKYLSEEGFQVEVITVKKETDNTTAEPEGVQVHYLPNKQLFKSPDFTIKTSRIGHYFKVAKKIVIAKLVNGEFRDWEKRALKKLVTIHQKNRIDILISSFSPISSHLVAINFVKDFKEVKWIADMRDAMTTNTDLGKREKQILKKTEVKVNQYATALISISKPHVEIFRKSMPQISNFEVVRNGYDHDFSPLNNFNDDFTISYLGSFYGLRKPHTFFEALVALDHKNQLPNNWKVKLVGTHHNFSIPESIKKKIEFVERVSQQESIEIMAGSDANLLIHPPTGEKGIYTGKIFDYISVKKPLIALVDKEDVAADLIRETKSGFIADFYDHKEIQEAILNAAEVWKKKEKLPFEGVEKLHRKYQVKKLAELIHKL